MMLFVVYKQTTWTVQLGPNSNKIVGQTTDYQLSIFFQSDVTSGASISLDFSNSQIIPPVGVLTTCQLLNTQNSVLAVYQGCSCSTGKVCTIPVTSTFSTGSVSKFQISTLTNPIYQQLQSVNLLITNSDNTKSAEQTLSISAATYTVQTIMVNSLTQASQLVQTANLYTITFKPVSNILANSQLNITLPNDVMISTVGTLVTKVGLNGGSLTTLANTQGITYQGNLQSILISSAFPSDFPANQNVVVTLANIVNPSSVRQCATGIQIIIKSVNGFVQMQNNLNTDLICGATVAQTITLSSQGIQATPTKTIQTPLQIMYFQFTPSLDFIANHQLKITLPSAFTLTSTAGQSSIMSASATASASTTFNIANKQIIMRGYIGNANGQYYGVLQGIVSPSDTQVTDQFQIQILDSSNNLVQQVTTAYTFQATAGALSVINSSPTVTSSTLAANVNVGFTIQAPHVIQSGSYIYTTFPSTIMNLKAGYVSPTCYKIVNNIYTTQTCTLTVNADNSMLVKMQEFCSVGGNPCAANTIMQYQIADTFANPPFIKTPPDSIQISLMTPNTLGVYDQITTGVTVTPSLVANPLTDLSIIYQNAQNPSSQSFVYTNQDKYTITFNPYAYFRANGGYAVISFPKGSIILISGNQVPKGFKSVPSQTSDCSYVLHNSDDVLDGIKSVQINGICSNGCPTGQITLEITQFLSPLSNQNIDTNTFPFQVATFSNQGYALDLGKMTSLTSSGNLGSLVPQNFNVIPTIVSNSQIVANSPTTYTITVSLNYPFPPSNHAVFQTKLYIQIPLISSNMQLNSGATCSVMNVQTIQLTCQVIDSLNGILNIFYTASTPTSSALTWSLILSQNIIITLNNVVNPPSLKPSGQFLMNTFTGTGNYIQQNSGQFIPTLTITQPAGLRSTTVTRSTINVNQQVILTFTIQLNTKLYYTNSYIEFDIPFQQAQFFTSAAQLTGTDIVNSFLLTNTGNGQTRTIIVKLIDSNYVNIWFQESSCPASCNAQSTLTYTLQNNPGVANPVVKLLNPSDTSQPSNFVKVLTYDNAQYQVDQFLQAIITPQLSTGVITMNSFTTNNRQVMNAATLTINVVIQNSFNPAQSINQILIILPAATYYPDKQSNSNYIPTCAINSNTLTTCTVMLVNENSNSNLAKYVQTIYLTLDSSTVNMVNANKNFNIIVSNIYNSYNYIAPNANQLVTISTTSTNRFFVMDTVQFSISTLNLLTNTYNSFGSITMARSVAKIGQPVVATFTINFKSIIQIGNYINIQIPKSQLVPISTNPICQVSINNVYTTISCNILNQNVQQFTMQFQISAINYCNNNGVYTAFCDVDSNIVVKISNILNNNEVPNFANIQSFQFQLVYSDLTTVLEQSSVDQSNMLPILLAASFLNLQITSNSTYVADQLVVQIQGQIETQLKAQSNILITFSNDLMLIGNNYQLQCKLAVLQPSAVFSVQLLNQIACNYQLNQLTFGLKSITISNPCRYDSSCPANTQIYIQFQATNLLYVQSYSGNVQLQGYSSNQLVVLSTSISYSSLGSLQQYQIANNNIVVTRSLSTSAAPAVTLTINYISPTRIISGSAILLQIPKDQISISAKPTSCTPIAPLNYDCSFTFDSTDATYYKFIFTQNYCNAFNTVFCEAYTQLSFTLANNIANPVQSKPNSGTFIQLGVTYNTNQVQSLTYNYNNVVTPLVGLGSLSNLVVTRSAFLTSQLTQINIQFTIQTAIVAGEFILIQFPNEMLIQDSGNAISVKRFRDSLFSVLIRDLTGSSISQFNSNNFYKQIMISGACTNDCTSGSTIYLSIINIRNNYFISLLPNQMMVISSLDSSSNLKDSGSISSSNISPAMSAQSLQTVNVIRSVSVFTLASSFTFTVVFNSGQVIPVGAIMSINLPVTQLNAMGNNYQLTNSNNNNIIPITNIISTSSTNFIIQFALFDTSTTTYNFILTGFQNANTNPAQTTINSLFVSLYTSNNQLMSVNSFNVFITPSMNYQTPNINNLVVSQSNFIDGQNTIITYSFNLVTPINSGNSNNFILDLPQYRFYFQDFNTKSLLDCQVFDSLTNSYINLKTDQCTATFDATNFYVNQMQFISVCGQLIVCSTQNQQIILKFTLKNQASTRGYFYNSLNQYFQLKLMSNNALVFVQQYLYLQPQASASSISNIIMTSSSSLVQKTNTVLTIKFNLQNIVPLNGNISITLPSQLINTIPSSCSASQTINSVATPIICKPTADGLIALVQSYSVPSTLNIYGNILMTTTINGVQNPYTNLPTDSLNIYSYGMYVEDTYLIDQNTSPLQYQATTLNPITVTSVTRSTNALFQPFTLTISFSVPSLIPAGGFVLLNVLPSYQMIFTVSSGTTLSCSNTQNAGQPIICYAYQTFIKIMNLCGVNIQCAAGSAFTIVVTSGIKNPTFVQETSMQLYSALIVGSQTGYIDGQTQGILAQAPLIPTILTVQSFSRTVNDCLKDTQITVKFSSSNPYNFKISTQFQINFPQNVMLPSQYKPMKCVINSVITTATCNYTLYTTQDVPTIQYVQVYNFCVTNDPCLVGESITVVIDGLMNAYEQWDYSQQNVVFRMLIQNYIYQYVQSEIFTSSLSNYFSSSVSTTSNFIDIRLQMPIQLFSTQMYLTIESNNYLTQGQYILIQFDNSVFSNNFNIAQCTGVYGASQGQGQCSVQNGNQLKIINYISSSVQQQSRILIQINNFVNPKTNSDGQIFTSIQSVKIFSVNDRLMEQYSNTQRMGFKVYQQRSMSCADKNCQFCLGSDNTNCLQCIVPNQVPLLFVDVNTQYSKGLCTNQCPTNTFIQNQYCYNCYGSCSSCLGPKIADCVGCSASGANSVFDSGYCGSQCLAGNTLITNANVFPVTSASYCQNTNTSACSTNCGTNCMTNPNYCTAQCSNSQAFSYQSKQCVSSTTCSNYGTSFSLDTSFNSFSQCKPCANQCTKCLDTKQSVCTQCNQYFVNQYNLNTACIQQCPFKQYAQENTNICLPCSTGCNTCRDGQSISCLSCSTGLYYYYGECLSNCPLGTVQSGINCLSGCANSNCFKCSGSSSNICTSCRGLNNILYNGNCISQCPQGTYYIPSTLTCSPCQSQCKSCSNANGCDLCKDSALVVYNNTCVTSCPTGYSLNYLTTVCMQFSCQPPCLQCGFYENQCVACINQFAYQSKCYSGSCPDGSYVNQTSLNTCNTCSSPCKTCSQQNTCRSCQSPQVLYNGACYSKCPMNYKNVNNVCTVAEYPITCIVLLILFAIAFVYYLISYFKNKLIINSINCFIFLPAPLLFLGRVFLLYNYWLNQNAALVAVTFITISTNCILGLIFRIYYLTLFEENLNNFQIFMKDHSKFYKSMIVFMIICGVKIAKIFNSGLLCIPKSNFEKLPPYLFSMNRLLNYSLLLSLAQFLASLYSVIALNSANDAFQLAILDILFSLICEIAFYYKDYKDYKMKLGYLTLPEQKPLNLQNDESKNNDENNNNEEENQNDQSNLKNDEQQKIEN